MKQGFIKLHRQILDWEWYDDPNTMRLFLHCLLRSNHKDNKWRGYLIKRGEFLTSLETLSLETKLSISQIRTAIKKLESTNEIASLSQARHRIITIINYDSYQSSDKLSEGETTVNRQAVGNQTATNKNEKNEKNEKKTKIPYQLIVDAYHSELNGMAKVVILSDKRKAAIKKLFNYHNHHQNIGWWVDYFRLVSGIKFLQGDNDRNWVADFEFITNYNKFIKIIEGKYS